MYKFSIRELLLVTVVVGLVAGWWIDRGRLLERAIAAEEAKEVYKFAAETLSDAVLERPGR